MSEDCVRAMRPDGFYYLPQQLPVGFKLTVGMVQEHDVLHADDGRRLSLLFVANLNDAV